MTTGDCGTEIIGNPTAAPPAAAAAPVKNLRRETLDVFGEVDFCFSSFSLLMNDTS
jgi:hypothetical protein